MAVYRVQRTRDYTVMSNYHLRDKNLTLKSKGLLSMILSLPDEWNYTTRGLAAICKEGVDAIGSALKELETAGYIVRRQLRGANGRITDTEYIIYERPHPREDSTPDTPAPGTDSPDTENPDMVPSDMDDSIVCRANTVIEAEAENRRILRETPVYPYPASYAREHGELEQYRASHKANIACKEAIEAAISEHYRDNRLGKEAAMEVIDAFGMDRTLYVLANTVRHKDWDGRISHDNKVWARTIPVYEDTDAWGDDRNTSFVVDKSHPGLTDIFLNQVRREQLLRTPLSHEEIKTEAARLLSEIQKPQEPNSPNGTHFMAQISPDFLARANSKDTEKLMVMLPFKSMSFSGLNDRKGHFVLISKEEDRSQPLRKTRSSVRKNLKKAPEKPAPGAAKKRKPEREVR